MSEPARRTHIHFRTRTLQPLAGIRTGTIRVAAIPARQLSTSRPVAASQVSGVTGNTGFAALTAGVGAYLVGNEILVLHAETVVAFSMGVMTYFLYNKAGPEVAQMLDDRSAAIKDNWAVSKDNKVAKLTSDLEAAVRHAPKHPRPPVPVSLSLSREHSLLSFAV